MADDMGRWPDEEGEASVTAMSSCGSVRASIEVS
jgi:hypothetical protein